MAPKIPKNYQNSQRSHRAIPLSSIDPQSAAEFEMLLGLNRAIWELFSIEVDLNKNKTGLKHVLRAAQGLAMNLGLYGSVTVAM